MELVAFPLPEELVAHAVSLQVSKDLDAEDARLVGRHAVELLGVLQVHHGILPRGVEQQLLLRVHAHWLKGGQEITRLHRLRPFLHRLRRRRRRL